MTAHAEESLCVAARPHSSSQKGMRLIVETGISPIQNHPAVTALARIAAVNFFPTSPTHHKWPIESTIVQ
jgi:hypothetical protein